ncbi:8522_t:CDS:2, partial [Gigaspora margarita]
TSAPTIEQINKLDTTDSLIKCLSEHINLIEKTLQALCNKEVNAVEYVPVFVEFLLPQLNFFNCYRTTKKYKENSELSTLLSFAILNNLIDLHIKDKQLLIHYPPECIGPLIKNEIGTNNYDPTVQAGASFAKYYIQKIYGEILKWHNWSFFILCTARLWQYNQKAHELYSKIGKAPKLLYINKEIVDGFYIVVMEYIKAVLLYDCDLLSHDEYKTILENIEEAINKLHEENIVFTNLCDSNILVNKSQDQNQGMLIDFDWAGIKCYLSFMNYKNIKWPPGAKDRKKLDCKHNINWLKSLKTKYLKLELLRQHISKLEAKNAKLEAEKAELLKQVMEKDAKYDAKNTELKSRVRELEAKLALLEQKEAILVVTVLTVDVSDSVIDQFNNEDVTKIPKITVMLTLEQDKQDLLQSYEATTKVNASKLVCNLENREDSSRSESFDMKELKSD